MAVLKNLYQAILEIKIAILAVYILIHGEIKIQYNKVYYKVTFGF
jgi:hypothetical protein